MQIRINVQPGHEALRVALTRLLYSQPRLVLLVAGVFIFVVLGVFAPKVGHIVEVDV